MSEFGRIDVLYNLAARSHLHWFEGFTDQEWAAAPTTKYLVFYLLPSPYPPPPLPQTPAAGSRRHCSGLLGALQVRTTGCGRS